MLHATEDESLGYDETEEAGDNDNELVETAHTDADYATYSGLSWQNLPDHGQQHDDNDLYSQPNRKNLSGGHHALLPDGQKDCGVVHNLQKEHGLPMPVAIGQTATAEDTDVHYQPDLSQTGRNPAKNPARGYLNRFSNPLVSRGAKVWEEVSVTVPLFMEAYIMRYAADTDMLADAGGRTTSGKVTLHVLFHVSEHRRPISRLLDLVIEAGEGRLSRVVNLLRREIMKVRQTI